MFANSIYKDEHLFIKMNIYFRKLNSYTNQILGDLKEYGDARIKFWFDPNSVFDLPSVAVPKTIKNIDYTRKNGIAYYEWDRKTRNVLGVYDGMASLLERSIRQAIDFIVIDDKLPVGGVCVLFQDNHIDKDYPKQFHRFKCFNDFSAILSFLKEELKFDPENMREFERRHGKHIEKGAIVYYNTKTKTYWYKDTFHKGASEHYEVYDAQGKHIGEADMDGNINTKKKDKHKKITI